MKYKVNDCQRNITFEVAMGTTILESALSQQIEFPHGCRSGNCGACKSILHSGEVEMSPYSKYALTNEEKKRGLILACRSVPWSDCKISIVSEDEMIVHSNRLLECKVTKLVQITHDIKILEMDIISGGPFSFTAGQYASLTFEKLPPRDYSMANTPAEDKLEFHIRLVPDGKVTPHIQNNLKVGDTVGVQGPCGSAYFRENHKGPIIAVAGGTGLAPIKSILKTALSNNIPRPITLYFGVRNARDLYLEREFTQLSDTFVNFNFIPVISEGNIKQTHRVGLLGDAIGADTLNLDGNKAYVAGPPIMVESVVKRLKKLGLQDMDCHVDAFYTEAEKTEKE